MSSTYAAYSWSMDPTEIPCMLGLLRTVERNGSRERANKIGESGHP